MGISPIGGNYYGGYGYPYGKVNPIARKSEDEKKISGVNPTNRLKSDECSTCESRRYQDQSSDSGVSMQTPTKVDPKSAETAVRAHEYEHVSRNKAKAAKEGKEIVSQSVSIKRTICPECGKSVVAGGETRTTTKTKNDKENDNNNNNNFNSNFKKNPYNVGLFDDNSAKGNFLDTAA